MKRFVSLMIGITILMVLCTGCKNKTPDKNQQPTKAYTTGTTTDGIYKNEYLNLKYTPDEGINVLNNEDLKKIETNAKTQSENKNTLYSDLNVEFCSKLNSESPCLLEVVSYKLANKNISEDEIMKTETAASKTDQTQYSTHKLGDTEFSKASNLKSDNTSITLLLKKVNDYYIEIIIIATDDEKINKLLSGFSKLEE